MSDIRDYEVRFLDHRGNLIEDVALHSRCLALAINCADVMAPQIGAESYFVTAGGSKIRAEWHSPDYDTDPETEPVGFFSN